MVDDTGHRRYLVWIAANKHHLVLNVWIAANKHDLVLNVFGFHTDTRALNIL